MAYPINEAVAATMAPPISDAFSWIPSYSGKDSFINLSQAVPGYPPADAAVERIAELAHEPGRHLYTDILGLPALRASFASELKRDYGGDANVADVAITAGCNQAFCLVIAALAGPGDNVILPLPYFFNHHMWLAMQGIEPRLFEAGGSPVDAQRAETLVDERTRAVVLVSPDNPTGIVRTPDAILALYEMAERRGIALVIDETYRDFRGFAAPAHPLFEQPRWRDTFVHLYSFSKAYALTGYRVGAIAAAPRLIGEIEKLMDCLAICAPHVSQAAVEFALEELGEWKAGKVALMQTRLEALRAAFADPELAYQMVSSGAFFAWVKHPFSGVPAREVARRLAADHGLLVLPGSMFGPGQEDFLRFAFANADATLMPDVVQRLIASQ
ncbi:MAG TPA: aminotransferase [Aestuariivirgaceae bacterium]|nr:aminotransferase [Aestuariivirgaceae bacterium]